jgi:hypothetical protein
MNHEIRLTNRQPLSTDLIGALYNKAIDPTGSIRSIEKLPWGSCNDTYQIKPLAGVPAILRVAPPIQQQFEVEMRMIRNAYAARPYLAHLSHLVPTLLFADFTHAIIDRDYQFESVLPGTPAPDALAQSSPQAHSGFFYQMGQITRQIHNVVGHQFGPTAGPFFSTWSAALTHFFLAAARDFEAVGLEAVDARALAAATENLSIIVDQIKQPRLMHGDGWTVNYLVNIEQTRKLTITGLCDWDRSEWGDPLADWAIQRAVLKPGTPKDNFWEGYGKDRAVASGARQMLYRARHLLCLRLDLIRPNRATPAAASDLKDNYQQVSALLAALTTGHLGPG